MVVSLSLDAPAGNSLKSLVEGFVLTKQTEGKSPRTVEYYKENLGRFLWFANKQNWSDDVRLLTEWHIRQFLGYVSSEKWRWGLQGNGSESSQKQAGTATLWHYYVVLSCFFRWVVNDGFLKDNPMVRIKVGKPKPKVITPYSAEDITRLLAVCERDYEGNAKFLGSRNRAIVLVLFDTGVRLSELVNIGIGDLDKNTGNLKVTGKGNKERMVRVGKVTQKALWRYLVYRQETKSRRLWLTEEGRDLTSRGAQSVIQRLLQRARITESGSVHKFRHTFALHFLRADRNVFNLQYLLGHNELEMVRRYTSTLGMEDALKAHEKASPADMMGLK